MKKPIKMIVIVIAVLLALGIAKDIVAKAAIEGGVTAVTGLKLSMSKFKLGITNSLIHIQGFKLHNPKGFEEKVMMAMPEMFVKVNFPAFFGGKIYLEEVRLDLAEFSVIRNKDGKLNLDALMSLGEGKPSKEKKPKKETKPMDLQIDVLELKVGKVQFKDHGALGKFSSQSFDAKIDERFENITSPSALVAIIVTRALKNTTIGRLADIDMGPFQDLASEAIADGKKVAEDAAKAAAEKFEELKKEVDVDKLKDATSKKFESSKEAAEEAFSSASDSMKDTAGSLKGSAGSLFGSLKAKVQKS